MNRTTSHRGVLRRATIGGAVALTLVLKVLAPGVAWAGRLTCLTGTDPSVAADLGQILAVQAILDVACPCDAFDGSRGLTHVSYTRCAARAINDQIFLGNLRRQCKGPVKKYYATSTCGRPASKAAVPCIRKDVLGKVTCRIKPNVQCVDSPARYFQVPCSGAGLCIQAADTNGDGIISSSDSAACVSPLPTPTSTKTPLVTPTVAVAPSVTPSPTSIASATSTVTATATPTLANTSTATPTGTATETPSSTQTPTDTATVTPTSTDTATVTPTDTATETPSSTQTATETATVTPSVTP